MAPIIDLIITIKNGYMARKESVETSHSVYREAVLKKLQKLGYVESYTVEGDVVKRITIKLLYTDSEPAVTDVKIFSKPGSRWYVSTKELKPVLGGMGHAILSTPKGILTNSEAKRQIVGGELLFHIW